MFRGEKKMKSDSFRPEKKGDVDASRTKKSRIRILTNILRILFPKEKRLSPHEWFHRATSFKAEGAAFLCRMYFPKKVKTIEVSKVAPNAAKTPKPQLGQA